MEFTGIQSLFSSALAGLYQDAELLVCNDGAVRDPTTGSFVRNPPTSVPVRVQFDTPTERNRIEDNFAHDEIIIRVLRGGLTVAPNADSKIQTAQGLYLVRPPLKTDPLTVYWELKCRLSPV